MLRAVLFDLDDTLVDDERASSEAVVAWAAKQGIADPGLHQRWATLSSTHYARYQRREITFQEQRRARVCDFLALDLGDAEADDLFADYLALYEGGWTAFDDAVPALRRVRDAGLTVAILTNGDDEQQSAKVDRVGLTSEIDVLIASSVLPEGKPAPRAFLGAMDFLGMRPDQALMVGDSLERDVRGALAAGLDAVLLDRHDQSSEVGVARITTLDALFGQLAIAHG